MKKILTFLLLAPIAMYAQIEEVKTSSDTLTISTDTLTKENVVVLKELDQKEKEVVRIPVCIAGDCENGTGTMNYPSGTYVGEWKDDLRNGQGTYKWTNGDIYKGKWIEDKRHGQGQYTWHDGSIYKGNYSHGIRSGYGIYYYVNGSIYEGTWQNNLKHGIANFYYKESVNIGGKYFNNEYVAGTGITQGSYKYKPE